MPKESLSIYFSIQDGGSSSVLSSLTDKTKALDKETQLLQQATDALTRANKPLLETQTKLQSELKSSQKEVNELQKSYDEYGDEIAKLRLDQAIEDHAKLKSELAEVNAQIGANQKSYKEYLETVRKGGLSDSGQEGQGIGLSGIAKGLVAGQIGQMFSSSLGGAFQAGLTSAMGTPAASLISDVFSSAIAGGTAGSMFGPWGIAAGAALGGLSGLVSGGTKIYEEQDSAFKEYYNGLIDAYGGLSAGNTASGSAIAAGRETDRISFSTMFGSEDAADRYLADLVNMSNSTPFLYEDLKSMSKTLATYGYDENSILPVLQTIGDAGAALGQSTSDMTSVATAIGRMVSSDKASLEYLNILNDRGINAVGYLAEARGKSVADTYADISKGNISGTEAAQIILDALESNYVGSMEKQSKIFAGLTSTLEGLQQEVANAAGEGYNTMRSDAIWTEINSLSGPLGDAMKEINTIIGENQARSENLQEEYMRQAIAAVLLGEEGGLLTDEQQAALEEMRKSYEYWSAEYAAGNEQAGLHMQSLYEQAQALGNAYYESSEWAQEEIDVQLEQIEAIRENTAGLAAAADAFRLSQEQSKGGAATQYGQEKAFAPVERFSEAVADASLSRQNNQAQMEPAADIFAALGEMAADALFGRSHAYGLDRVPYDDYPALLHEGERVLTASEARTMDKGAGTLPLSVTVTGNNFVGTGEEMADQIAEILVRKLEQAAVIHQPR